MHKQPRQIDVAKLAGVSSATVSIILNNRLDSNVRISAETRARVLAAVEQLGYVVDPVAQSLAGGANTLLGLFAGTSIFAATPPAQRYSLLVGIEQAAAAHGYDLLFFTNMAGADHIQPIYQGNINRLRMASGAILLGAIQNSADLARLLTEAYPFVCVGRCEVGDGAPAYVAADSTSATATLVTELLTCGHRQIAYIGALGEQTPQRERYTGYLLAYRQAGLSTWVTPAQRLAAQTISASFLQQALQRGITAFVLEDSSFVAPFFLAMQLLGKHAPTDFSLALLDDPTGLATPYPVTGFVLPYETMGRRAVQLLVDLMHATHTPQLRQELLACPLAPGITIAPPAP